MKIKYIISLFLLLSAIHVKAQTDVFDKFSNNNDITVVYVSKAMLQMVGPSMNMGGADISNLINKIDQIEVYTTQKKAVAETMKRETDKFVKNKIYENLMLMKEGKENFTFLGRKDKDLIKELVMISSEPAECTIIRLEGSFTMEDIQKIIEERNQKPK